MAKVILISQKPLPYHNIGSWTTMYKNYFEANNVNIDAIVCQEPKNRFNNIEYYIVPNNFITKVKRRITKKPHQAYIDTLLKNLNPSEKYILQVVDNFGFVKALYTYLRTKKSLRNQLYIQFFYHGYPPFYGNFESRWFFEFIDEMVLLTHASYLEHKQMYTILPCLFSVLHNGIDTTKFYKITKEHKEELKLKHQVENKMVFLWCSQDRSKKGLDLMLYVWKILTKKYNDIELWVIGAKREMLLNNVRFFGKIPNDELPEYYQVSDCYLFPALNQEGFGLTIIEALHCGNHCIVSALGGIPEVMQFGKFGTLIENPHFIDEWVAAIEAYIVKQSSETEINLNLYTKENWINGMNEIISKAKEIFS
jgi:glycosyltransferase involved in cell wall biosynthesis